VGDTRDLLRRIADHAADFLERLDDRPVFPDVGFAELREAPAGRCRTALPMRSASWTSSSPAPDPAPSRSRAAATRMVIESLRTTLRDSSGPTIVCAQAGEVNTGAFDRLPEIAAAARDAGAWLHVDGAFGLWAAERGARTLVEGAEAADSWATDAHT
jgi:predicted anti-sigma-YlaC factor YlaD